jgi:hypothetical protein
MSAGIHREGLSEHVRNNHGMGRGVGDLRQYGTGTDPQVVHCFDGRKQLQGGTGLDLGVGEIPKSSKKPR